MQGPRREGPTQHRPAMCRSRDRVLRSPVVAVFLLVSPGLGTPTTGTEVPAAALAAYEKYVQLADAKFLSEVGDRELFLDIRNLSGKQRAEAFAIVRRGSTYVRKIQLRDADGQQIHPDHALIHHWIGTAFIPGATLEQILALAKSYDTYSTVFAPDVTASRLLSHTTPDDMKVFLRLRKKKIRTFVYDTEHSVHYVRLDADRAYSTAYATLVREVEHPGTARERRKDDGEGFLWRIRTYWRYAQVDGGLYLENESLMLTRRVPFLARLIVGPIIRAGTRDGVETALSAVRRALSGA